MMQAQLIRPEQMMLSHWAGGSTRQLAISPPGATVAAQDFHWRFSSATVLQNGQFSRFVAHQRLLALRQGVGMVLQIDQQTAVLSHPQQCVRFAGAANSSATLLAGAVTDINLMLAKDWQGNLWAEPLAPDWQRLQFARPQLCTLLCYADEAAVEIELITENQQQYHWQLALGEALQLTHLSQHSHLSLRLTSSMPPASQGATQSSRPSLVVGWLCQQSHR
jgi:environmental stress-induced protein Ves